MRRKQQDERRRPLLASLARWMGIGAGGGGGGCAHQDGCGGSSRTIDGTLLARSRDGWGSAEAGAEAEAVGKGKLTGRLREGNLVISPTTDCLHITSLEIRKIEIM